MNDDDMRQAFDKIWDENSLILLIMLLLAYGKSDISTKQTAEPKQDCEYYDEEHDMGKSIPYCKRIGAYFDFDCENCPHYRLSERMIKLKKIVERMEKTMPKEEDRNDNKNL